MKEEDLREKLENLKDSFDSGFIKKAEYEKEKDEVESELNKLKKEDKEQIEKEPEKEEKKISDKALIVSVIIIAVLFIIFFSIKFLIKPKVNTIDDLHLLNIQGKLKPEQGYMYKGFSFVKSNDLWYTQIQVGNTLIDIPLHYGPADLKDIPLEGAFNTTLFDSSDHVFMAFNPLGGHPVYEFTYIKLATAEIDMTLIKAFGKAVIGSCDRNETDICKTSPIVTCDSTKDPVIYIKESNETKVTLSDNCFVVEGNGLEVVRAADRLLLKLYGIL